MNSILSLLFPPICLLCDEVGEPLCNSCNLKFRRLNRSCSLGEITIWPAALYGDELASVIVAAKDQNSAPARNILVQLLVGSFKRAAVELRDELPVALIPIPSSVGANRRRGFRHAQRLASDLARTIRAERSGEIQVVEALRVNRKIVDQSVLNKSERIQNLDKAHSLNPRALPEPGIRANFLVDDLVTSGSTVLEGVRALKEGGIIVKGVLCAGVSPRVFS